MTIRRYYEISLFVPVAGTLLMAVAGFGFGSVYWPFGPDTRSPGFGTAVLAIPYLGLAVLARRRMRPMSEPELVKLSLVAPFLFAAVTCLSFCPLVVVAALGGLSPVIEAGGMVLGVGLLALLGAAEFVLLANGVLFLGYKAKLVRRETRVGWLG